MSNRENINWVKPLDLRKNLDISGPAEFIRGNSLRMRRESISSRKRNSFCSWATIRDNFFLNRVVQTWNSFPNNSVTSPSLNTFKTSIDERLNKFVCYSFWSSLVLYITRSNVAKTQLNKFILSKPALIVIKNFIILFFKSFCFEYEEENPQQQKENISIVLELCTKKSQKTISDQ